MASSAETRRAGGGAGSGRPSASEMRFNCTEAGGTEDQNEDSASNCGSVTHRSICCQVQPVALTIQA